MDKWILIPCLGSLPNNKSFDWSKLKAFEDDKRNVTENLKFVLGKAEHIVEKEKMLVTISFSLSHKVLNS